MDGMEAKDELRCIAIALCNDKVGEIHACAANVTDVLTSADPC